jgi:hypothetical protein
LQGLEHFRQDTEDDTQNQLACSRKRSKSIHIMGGPMRHSPPRTGGSFALAGLRPRAAGWNMRGPT